MFVFSFVSFLFFIYVFASGRTHTCKKQTYLSTPLFEAPYSTLPARVVFRHLRHENLLVKADKKPVASAHRCFCVFYTFLFTELETPHLQLPVLFLRHLPHVPHLHKRCLQALSLFSHRSALFCPFRCSLCFILVFCFTGASFKISVRGHCFRSAVGRRFCRR